MIDFLMQAITSISNVASYKSLGTTRNICTILRLCVHVCVFCVCVCMHVCVCVHECVHECVHVCLCACMSVQDYVIKSVLYQNCVSL